MQQSHATRRGLIVGLAILPTAVVVPALAKPVTLSALWVERQRLYDMTNAATSEVEADALFNRLSVAETAILRGPINSRADAAAKARLALYGMEAGLRGDGADVASIRDLAEWLERS